MFRTDGQDPELLMEWIRRTPFLDGIDLETELIQSDQEGREVDPYRSRFETLLSVPGEGDDRMSPHGGERDLDWLAAAEHLVRQVQNLPTRRDYEFDEPSDLGQIRAVRPAPGSSPPSWDGNHSEFEQRLSGGLLGRMCGCLLGKPVEGASRAAIRLRGEQTGNWPIADYFDRDKIVAMPEDDDINYTVIGFAVLKRRGASFTPLDIAQFWLENLPILHTFTAERAAYRNFVRHVVPPLSATELNPYREWIGAQIRADFWGYANPGNPERAAEWAWRDASVSHVKNGIYGEMWVAAMLAAAYVLPLGDWRPVIRAGLDQIPAKCRLREAVEQVCTWHDEGQTFESVVDKVHEAWDESTGHGWCHTISNAMVVTAGLLWGEDDYEASITKAVMAGFDTDCNGATVGSLWGIRHGRDAVPSKWSAPLNDRVSTGVAGSFDCRISEMANEMAKVAAENS